MEKIGENEAKMWRKQQKTEENGEKIEKNVEKMWRK